MLLKQRFENTDFWGFVSAMFSSAFLSSLLSTPALSVNLNSASHPQAKLLRLVVLQTELYHPGPELPALNTKTRLWFLMLEQLLRKDADQAFLPSCLPHLPHLGQTNPITINWERKHKWGSSSLSTKSQMMQLSFTYRIPGQKRLCSQLTLCLLLRALHILRVTFLQDIVLRNASSSQRECNTIQVTTQTKAQLTQVLVGHPLTVLKTHSHVLEQNTCLLHSCMFPSGERQQQCYTNTAKDAVK